MMRDKTPAKHNFLPTINNPTQPKPMNQHTANRNARSLIARASYRMESIAATLERLAQNESNARKAQALDVMASDLAHHADAIREACGMTADTEANLVELTANPQTR